MIKIKIKVKPPEELEEVYSEKQRRYMCHAASHPSEGVPKKAAEEMCRDTAHSKEKE